MKCSITSSLNHKAVSRCIAVVSKWIEILLKRNMTSTLISSFSLFRNIEFDTARMARNG